MDVIRTLRAILAPSAGPVNHDRPPVGRPATPSGPQSFATALKEAANLEDPDIGTFGVIERLQRPAERQERPSVDPGRPTIGPDLPDAPGTDLPLEPPPIEIRDTIESMTVLILKPEVLSKPEPIQPPVGQTKPQTPVSEPKAPLIMSLPPVGVLWAPESLRASGASGPGIAGTDAATQTDLANKFEYYTNPEKYGLTLNQEARLFLDAVDKGYISKSPEGLGTLLSTLGRGAIGPTARPPEMTEYFRQFFAPRP